MGEMSPEQRAAQFFEPFEQQHYYHMLVEAFRACERSAIEDAAKVADNIDRDLGAKGIATYPEAIAAAIRSLTKGSRE